MELEPAVIAIVIVGAAYVIPRLISKKPSKRAAVEKTAYAQTHYHFAFNYLPGAVFKMPHAVHAITNDPQARAIWTKTGDNPVLGIWRKMLDLTKVTAPADPTVEVVERPWGHAILVTMPEPPEMPLAWFIAIVPESAEKALYFTLEKTLEDRTVLGGVDQQPGHHVNYGGGPPPEREAFLDAVGKLVAAKG